MSPENKLKGADLSGLSDADIVDAIIATMDTVNDRIEAETVPLKDGLMLVSRLGNLVTDIIPSTRRLKDTLL